MCMYRLENLKAIGLQYLSCISGSLRREKGMKFYVFEKGMIAYLPYVTFIRLLDALASPALTHIRWWPTNRHSLCWSLCNLRYSWTIGCNIFSAKGIPMSIWISAAIIQISMQHCAAMCCRTPFSLSHGGGGGRHQIAGKGERGGSQGVQWGNFWRHERGDQPPLTCNHLLAINWCHSVKTKNTAETKYCVHCFS